MSILDRGSLFESPGIESVVESLALFPSQIEQSWNEVGRISLSASLRNPENIVLVGMGGSALGGEVLKNLEFHLLKVPLEIVRGYHLPGYIGKESLIILSSYSGETEEVLSVGKEALKKTKKIFVFTTGGELAEFANDYHLPTYDPAPVFNPSALPRLSLGYSLTMLLSLLARLSLLRINRRRLNSLVTFLRKNVSLYGPLVTENKNPSKKLAELLNERLPVLVSGDHLSGAITAARNMFHETSKTFAVAYPIPELDHHLLESLSFPKDVSRRLTFLFLVSRFDHKEIKQRVKITAEVLEKRQISFERIVALGETPLEEVYWSIQFFGYVSFYLAMLYGVDPGSTPWVDYLKKALRRQSVSA